MTDIRGMSLDEVIGVAREKMLQQLEESELKFVDDVTGRGAMTLSEAIQFLADYRPTVLEDFENRILPDLRAWLIREGKSLQ